MVARTYRSVRSRAPRPVRGPITAAARTVGAWTSSLRTLPAFLIVGGQRCGTNSLYEHLVLHPDVRRALASQEVHFFDRHFHRGLSWYRGQFPLRPPGGRAAWATGESTPYYMFHPLVPRRIADALPEVRLIALLRDPIERAYSHYHHERSRGVETLPFEEAIEREAERLAGEVERITADPGYQSFTHQHFSYLARGRYLEQLHALYSMFPQDRILVLVSERYFADPSAGYARVLSFLGLRPFSPAGFGRHNQGRYPGMAPGLRRRLAEHFAEPNDRLFRFLNEDCPWG